MTLASVVRPETILVIAISQKYWTDLSQISYVGSPWSLVVHVQF